jgi:hypothetical protein
MLTNFTVTDLPPSPAGLSVKFKIVAYNLAGYNVTSHSTTIVIASVPYTPMSPPYSDPTVTSGSVIKILYDTPGTGGSPITNYEI